MGVSYFITFTEKPGDTFPTTATMEVDQTIVKTANFTPMELGAATEVAKRIPDILGGILQKCARMPSSAVNDAAPGR